MPNSPHFSSLSTASNKTNLQLSFSSPQDALQNNPSSSMISSAASKLHFFYTRLSTTFLSISVHFKHDNSIYQQSPSWWAIRSSMLGIYYSSKISLTYLIYLNSQHLQKSEPIHTLHSMILKIKNTYQRIMESYSWWHCICSIYDYFCSSNTLSSS